MQLKAAGEGKRISEVRKPPRLLKIQGEEKRDFRERDVSRAIYKYLSLVSSWVNLPSAPSLSLLTVLVFIFFYL